MQGIACQALKNIYDRKNANTPPSEKRSIAVKQRPKNGFQRPVMMGTAIISTTLLMPNTLPSPIIIYYVYVDSQLKTSSEIEFNYYFLAIDMKI